MTEKDLEEIKQKYGFTLRPIAFNGKPSKYVSRKEYEEKMCGNDVNRNNDRIFSWLWKQQGRKR